MIVRLSQRGFVALASGIVMAAAVTAVSFAQDTAPRDLPATPPAAENPPPPPNAAPPGQNLRPFVPRQRGQFARGGNRLERRLAFLHRALRINASQEQLWDNFADAVRNEADAVRDRFRGPPDGNRGGFRGPPDGGRGGFRGPPDGRRDGFRGPPDGRRGDVRRDEPSVVERLEQREQALADRSARVERLLTALRPLYAALNDEQKETADELFFRPGEDRGPGFFNRQVPPNFGRGGFGRPFDRGYNSY